MFWQLSIHKKLALTLWGAVFLVLAGASAGLLIFQNITLERRARQIMEPYAQLVSVGAEGAVIFGDPGRAKEILNTLSANPQLLESEIVLEDGTLLASYNSRSNAPARLPRLGADGIQISGNRAELVQSLSGGGHLRLIMSLDGLRQQTRQILWLFSLGMLALLASTVGLMAVLQRTIVRPISTLVEAAEQVRTRSDYQRRVPASGGDEVARLGRSFNAMMEAVQQRENDLREISVWQRTILDNAAYGIISASPEGLVTSFNFAAERLLGYVAAEIVGIKTPVLWHDPDELARSARELSQETGGTIAPGFGVFAALACNGQPSEREWTFIRKDGTRVPVSLSLTALRNENGRVTGYVGLVYDLTERKRAAQALLSLNEELERRVKDRTADLLVKSDELKENQRALLNIIEDLNDKTVALEAVNKELESFSYSVSHDLRGPLRSIDGFSRALLEDYADKLDPEGKEDLQTVRNASQRMGHLIDDMLRLSQLNRGVMRQTEVNLSQLVRQVAEELQSSDAGRNVEFVVAPDCIAMGDAALLRIAVENMVGNAWKYTGKKARARIEFGLVQTAEGEAYFVRDDGCGFDMKYVHKLFGAFQRLHSPEEFPGTGIGLASVQRVIKRHGGRVWIEGKVDEGTTLYFTLPGICRTS